MIDANLLGIACKDERASLSTQQPVPHRATTSARRISANTILAATKLRDERVDRMSVALRSFGIRLHINDTTLATNVLSAKP
jgi:hypothetical protein